MAKLLNKKTADVRGISKGDKIIGTITKITRDQILVDLGGKTDAQVLEKDRQLYENILNTLKEGDKAEVYVLNPESDMGYAVVSLRKFMQEKTWGLLSKNQKDQDLLDAKVTDVLKGGYLIQLNSGQSGFLPYGNTLSDSDLVQDSEIKVYISELKPNDNRIIVSQKKAIDTDDIKQIKSQYKKDQKVKIKVKTITSFGIFTSLPFKSKEGIDREIDGLIHVSEASWDKVELGAVFSPNQDIEVIILGFDDSSKRLDLSVKRLADDPFESVKTKYPMDTKVSGSVSEIKSGNIHIELEDGITGIMKKDKVPPDVTYKEGDTVSAIVTDYDKRGRKLLLVPQLLKKTIGYR